MPKKAIGKQPNRSIDRTDYEAQFDKNDGSGEYELGSLKTTTHRFGRRKSTVIVVFRGREENLRARGLRSAIEEWGPKIIDLGFDGDLGVRNPHIRECNPVDELPQTHWLLFNPNSGYQSNADILALFHRIAEILGYRRMDSFWVKRSFRLRVKTPDGTKFVDEGDYSLQQYRARNQPR